MTRRKGTSNSLQTNFPNQMVVYGWYIIYVLVDV